MLDRLARELRPGDFPPGDLPKEAATPA